MGTKSTRHKHVPQRTCVVCRQKTDKRLLTRVVRTAEEGLAVDPSGKRNGRGAYLCDNPACWDKAIRTRVLDQALRIDLTDDERQALSAHRPAAVADN